MSTLELFSEPFAKTGNMAAEGFRRLLGRPTLDLLQTFVREGIQNVLDAGSGGRGPKVLIRLRTLTEAESATLRVNIFPQLPAGDSTRAHILASLNKERIAVLELCDFNTEGLSGPTRADAAHEPSQSLNFVNFLRNVGAGRDTHQGGGTYGYGKSSLYAMSTCATIVVDSLAACGSKLERRLMACHLGAAFDATVGRTKRRRYTGRHWWGVLDGDDSIEPARGRLARSLSSKLGMPPRDSDETGTSIMVIDPFIDPDGHDDAVEEIVETVLWNFWPRMTATTPAHQRVEVSIEFEGIRIPVPNPEDFPPLDLFAAAMADIRNRSSDNIPIICQRPNKRLGHLAIRRGLCADRIGPALGDETAIPRQASHIALMRPVQLVVKYLEGVAFADSRFEWAGVFMCSDEEEVEAAFADSEPPAHDDWVPDNLPKGQGKTMVRVGLARLTEYAKTYANPGALQSDVTTEQMPSLAATASKMGAFLTTTGAAGPGRQARPTGGGGLTRRTIALSRPRSAGLKIFGDGTVVAVFKAELTNDASKKNLQIAAEPTFVVDGGNIDANDLPASMKPRVAQMSFNGRVATGSSNVVIVGKEAGEIEVLLPVVDGAAIGVKLTLRDGEST